MTSAPVPHRHPRPWEPPAVVGSGSVAAPAYRVYGHGSWTVLSATGPLGWHFARDVRDLLRALPTTRLVFDLSQVTSIDHSALAMLARAHRVNRSLGRTVRLVAPAEPLLRAPWVYDLPPMCATIEEATS